MDTYLRKINATDTGLYLNPILNKRIIYKMMEELCLCYRYLKDDNRADEIQQLMQMLIDAEETEE